MQDQPTNSFTLTLKKVKECIAFQTGSPLHTLLCKLCDLRFEIEKLKGATDEEAAKAAFDWFSEIMIELGDRLKEAENGLKQKPKTLPNVHLPAEYWQTLNAPKEWD